MTALTKEELSALTGQLQIESALVQKYVHYAAICTDPQLKTKCEEIAAKHRNHCQTLVQRFG